MMAENQDSVMDEASSSSYIVLTNTKKVQVILDQQTHDSDFADKVENRNEVADLENVSKAYGKRKAGSAARDAAQSSRSCDTQETGAGALFEPEEQKLKEPSQMKTGFNMPDFTRMNLEEKKEDINVSALSFDSGDDSPDSGVTEPKIPKLKDLLPADQSQLDKPSQRRVQEYLCNQKPSNRKHVKSHGRNKKK